MTLRDRMADFQPTFIEPMKQKYYIGDLCYVLSSDDWFTYCAAYGASSDEDGYDPEIWLAPEEGEWEAYLADDGKEPWRPCFAFNTAYGDGCYTDQNGLKYSVDSGGIGCIRVDHANAEKLADAVARGLGHIHEFEELPSMGEEDGVIWFVDHTNQVEINTAGGYDDEEEEADEDDA